MLYSNYISLVKNKRGVYDFDTTKGCKSGLKYNLRGCYEECYAAKISKAYGMEFNITSVRKFKDFKHLELILYELDNIDIPFVRIGVSGDPSENWENTLQIIKLIKGCDKKIVIITKHWKTLTATQLVKLSKLDVCVNTSVSALDDLSLTRHRLIQYEILKNYCNSILRIVSCDFNRNNLTGLYLGQLQDYLFEHGKTIDTVFRTSVKNKWVRSDIVKVAKKRFLEQKQYISKFNKNTFIGYCDKCPEMCGINL